MKTIDQKTVFDVLKEYGPMNTHDQAEKIIPGLKGYDQQLARSKCSSRCVAMAKFRIVQRMGTDDEGRTIWGIAVEEYPCQR